MTDPTLARISTLFFASVLLAGCASTNRPTSEMIYASAALKAAERVQAERKSPDLFNRAQNSYWKANKYYLTKDFDDAHKYAIESRRLAERAELDAELKNAQSTGLPGE